MEMYIVFPLRVLFTLVLSVLPWARSACSTSRASSERHGRRHSLLFVRVETGSLFEIGMCVTDFQKKNWRQASQETDFSTVRFPGSKLRGLGLFRKNEKELGLSTSFSKRRAFRVLGGMLLPCQGL